MRILITGVAGFIGSHLAERFIKEGHKVLGVDNFITGNFRNIKKLVKSPNFKFKKLDISKKTIDFDADIVMHFASPASPVDYYRYPLETLKAGSYGTFNTLNIARKNDARYILASTSEVYGDPEVHPQKESYWGNVNPIGPRAVYDEAKRFAEATTAAYHREFGLDTRIIRIFNTYGPRMKPDDGRVIPNFITQALKGEKITVYGDGTQTRSFCYIDDLVEGIYRLSIKDNLDGEVVNLGNPEEYRIIDLAKLIIDLVGKDLEITYKKLPKDDPKRRRPDITKAKKLIGWEPKTPLKIGLKKTIKYFKKILGEKT